jgi:hypothetical protein
MIERGSRSCFAQEPFAVTVAQSQIVRKEFQRDVAFELQVLRLVYDAHSARAEPCGNAVVRNGFANHGQRVPRF